MSWRGFSFVYLLTWWCLASFLLMLHSHFKKKWLVIIEAMNATECIYCTVLPAQTPTHSKSDQDLWWLFSLWECNAWSPVRCLHSKERKKKGKEGKKEKGRKGVQSMWTAIVAIKLSKLLVNVLDINDSILSRYSKSSV